VRPDLPGSKHEGVFLLHSMDDSFAVHQYLTDRKPRAAVLVGAGYIGLEMADALTQRGIEVTLLCRAETVLPTVDPALGRLVEEELRRHGIRVRTGVSAVGIDQTETGRSSRLSIVDSTGAQHAADLVLLAVGARPDSELAEQAGVKLGAQGAVVVTRQMRTNLADVFAAGDCVETYHRLFDVPTYISLGTIAHKQGRVAGENAIGGDRIFAGALGTQSLKVFDLPWGQFKHRPDGRCFVGHPGRCGGQGCGNDMCLALATMRPRSCRSSGGECQGSCRLGSVTAF
jgi:NADPH-dependent 2,4-dienoyl-CoA reductase/sulfur reductase-like enzyme